MGKIYLNEEEFGSSGEAILEEYDYAYLNGYKFEIPISLSYNHKVEIDFQADAYSNLMAMMGNNGGNNAWAWCNLLFYNNQFLGINTYLASTGFDQRHQYTYNQGGRDYFDGVDKGASYYYSTAPSSSVKYQIGFSSNGSSSTSYKGKIFSFKITDNTNDEVLCELIPAKLIVCGATLKAGLFDRISGIFYENEKITLGNL